MTTLTVGLAGWAVRQRLGRWFGGLRWPWQPGGRHHAPLAALTPPVHDQVIPRVAVAGRPPWDPAPAWQPIRPNPIVPVARLHPDIITALGAPSVRMALIQIFGQAAVANAVA
jgi:hypothetical protein